MVVVVVVEGVAGEDSCSDKQKGAPQRGDKSVDGQSGSALKEFLKLQGGTTQAEGEVRFRRKGPSGAGEGVEWGTRGSPLVQEKRRGPAVARGGEEREARH